MGTCFNELDLRNRMPYCNPFCAKKGTITRIWLHFWSLNWLYIIFSLVRNRLTYQGICKHKELLLSAHIRELQDQLKKNYNNNSVRAILGGSDLFQNLLRCAIFSYHIKIHRLGVKNKTIPTFEFCWCAVARFDCELIATFYNTGLFSVSNLRGTVERFKGSFSTVSAIRMWQICNLSRKFMTMILFNELVIFTKKLHGPIKGKKCGIVRLLTDWVIMTDWQIDW